MTEQPLTQERTDILETLTTHRRFLLFPARGLTDEQANLTPTVSALSIGGLIKHVAATEAGWARFAVEGASGLESGQAKDFSEWTADDWAARDAGFALQPGETLAGVTAEYAEVARATDELVRTLPDLDAAHPLPAAPWFVPGATRSARRVFLHIVAETAQHAGHADIIREAIDGTKTMG